MTNNVFLSLGSNLGDRMANLRLAVSLLYRQGYAVTTQSSGVYETAAWGDIPQPDFLNAVIQVETVLEPIALMEAVLAVERQMGRVRTQKWGPRTIDIDILFWGETVIATERLTVPHPYVQDRRFILKPLKEIAPDFMHPVLLQTIENLWSSCIDPLEVRGYSERL